MFGGNLTNLLIVESKDGQVYFVEDEKKSSKLDQIRRNKKIEEEKKIKREEAIRKVEESKNEEYK